MREGWPHLPLEKAIGPRGRIVGGPFGSDLTQSDYVESGVPVIRVGNQIGATVAGEFVYVSQEKAQRLKANIAEPGDIVIVQRGSTYGKVSRIPHDAAFDRFVVCQSQMAVAVDDTVSSPEFIFQALRSPGVDRFIESEVIQTGQPHINLGILKRVKIPLPTLPEQRKIAAILQTWDEALDKLAALRAAKERTLKGLAQTLLGRGGVCPDRWPVKPLSAICARIRRQNGGGDHPVMTISAKSGFLMQSDKFARDMAGSSVERYTLLHEGEFAYNKGNSLTAPYGCIFRLEKPTALVPFVYFCFALKPGLDPAFYEHLFAAGTLNHQLSRLINSGIRNDGLLNLNVEDFFACNVPVPPVHEQRGIALALSAAKDELSLLDQEIAALTRQKRGLMQKLLTGDWQVEASA